MLMAMPTFLRPNPLMTGCMVADFISGMFFGAGIMLAWMAITAHHQRKRAEIVRRLGDVIAGQYKGNRGYKA